MRPPRRLRVAGRDYRTRMRPPAEMPGVAGLCHYDQFLDIRRGQTALEEADTFIHEAFHAVLYGQGRAYGGPTEERYVRALATGLVQLLRDNPSFGRYLASI